MRVAAAFVAIVFAFLPAPPAAGAPAREPAAAGVPPALFQDLHWRYVGPYRAGWATSATGVPGAPHTFYFGAAGGGVWRTDDAGQTWRGLMQHERSSAIGALAIAPSNPRVLYAGTGQEGTRYDIMPGDGVYRTDDGGETWRQVGLGETQHIGAILVDPNDENRVLVAAIGHAFAPNRERGVYLTTDGGRSWRAVLQPDDSTGAVDLASDPTAPRIVYASTWQRRMRPWLDYFMPTSAAGSGVWRSDNAGEHWTRLTDGLPTGPLGRIGLAVARGTGGRIVYASVVAPGGARGQGGGLYRSGDWGGHWKLVNADGSLADGYFGRLTVAPEDSSTVYVMGQSIRRSRDGGKTFEVMRGSPGGDDYHQLWIDPEHPASMIAASDQGAAVSLNGGATWSSWYNQPTGQFYHLGADERFPYRIYSGQQDNGTVEISSRGPYGSIDERDWHPVGGDERDDMIPEPGHPETVFGSGLGGGVSRFDEETRQSSDVSPWPLGSYGARPNTVRYRYGWITPLSFSPLPPHALYLGAQVLFRSLDGGAHWDAVSPDLSGRREGAGPCDDPGPAAASACGFGVLSAIAPSPLAAGRIWTGTDDGRIHMTRDGGASWRDVTPPAVPAWGAVFAIDASPFDTASAYAAIDLHRIDRHQPLLLRTHDSGRSWTVITRGLPADEFTSVVRADPGRKGLLYAGTNRGVYVSFDDGEAWQSLSLDLPTTWMRDLLPHDGDLVLATQGRGIWVLDDVAPLREIGAPLAREAAHLFAPARATRLRASESHDTPWPPETPLGENPPSGAAIDYWIGPSAAHTAPVTLTITDSTGALVRRFSSADPPESLVAAVYFERAWVGRTASLSATPGMHRFVWDLRGPRPPAPNYHYTIAAVWGKGTGTFPYGPFVLPGRYTVTLAAGGLTLSRPLEVRIDPRVNVSPEGLREQLERSREAVAVLERAMAAVHEIERLRADSTARRPAAIADSLTRMATALPGAAGSVSRVLTELQSADAAPTQGMIDALEDSARRVDALLGRWRNIVAALPR